MKNGQVKKLKEPARLFARCAPASKIFRCCSNSSRFSTSLMTVALHLVISFHSKTRPADLLPGEPFRTSGVLHSLVRCHVILSNVEVIRRAHLADGVIQRVVGRHRSERALDVTRMIRTA